MFPRSPRNRFAIPFALCLAILSLLSAGAARAADPAAQAFLDAIYRTYGSPNSHGTRINSKAALDRYFTPELAGLIDKDAKAAKQKGEVPALDGDPFIDAQDWDIKGLKITVSEHGAGKAGAAVSFTNFGEERKVSLELTKTAAGWRIDDIHWREGSLRGLYRAR
jgi:hypothetical protein